MDARLSTLQHLDPGIVTLCALLVFSIALATLEPITGRRDYRTFLLDEAERGEAARVRFYRRWVRFGCATATAAVVLVASLPGVALADLGLRAPDLSAFTPSSADGLTGGLIQGMAVGTVLAVGGGLALAIVRARKTRAADPAGTAPSDTPGREQDPRLVALAPMLPRTPAGRRGWAALSLSAGVTEEITFRGLLLLTLAVILPSSTPGLVLVAISAVLFGIAHWYQGWQGMVGTGVLGAVFAVTYLATGSLLVPMVLHTLVDLRVLLLPVPSGAPSRTAS